MTMTNKMKRMIEATKKEFSALKLAKKIFNFKSLIRTAGYDKFELSNLSYPA
ncbi:hypothetical protein AB7W12_09160 [Providencia rettgeri]